MAYNSSITSYPDIRAALDKALDSPKGVRLSFEDKKAAVTFCGRVHSFRWRDRKENQKIYSPDDPMFGRSAYDPLMLKRVNETTVDVVKLEAVEFSLEELT